MYFHGMYMGRREEESKSGEQGVQLGIHGNSPSQRWQETAQEQWP